MRGRLTVAVVVMMLVAGQAWSYRVDEEIQFKDSTDTGTATAAYPGTIAIWVDKVTSTPERLMVFGDEATTPRYLYQFTTHSDLLTSLAYYVLHTAESTSRTSGWYCTFTGGDGTTSASIYHGRKILFTGAGVTATTDSGGLILTITGGGGSFYGFKIGNGTTSESGITSVRFPGASISTDKTSAGVVTIAGSGDVLHTDVSTSRSLDWYVALVNLDDLADVTTGDENTSEILVRVSSNWTTGGLNPAYLGWANKLVTFSSTAANSITLALMKGGNVSNLVNDAGYITSSTIAAGDIAADTVFLSNLQNDMETSLSNALTMPVGSNDNSMTDPGADRILMWDESSNSPAWATANTNLSFDGTNLNASGGSGFSTGSVIWQIDEHFIGGRYDVTGSLGENGWRYDAINAGSIGPLGAYSNRFGVFRLRSGTNSNGGVAVSCTDYGVTAGEIYADSGLRIEWVVYLPALANWTNDYELLIGGFDNTSSATVTDGIYFLYDISRDDDWCAVTKDSTATITDTSTSVTATTWVTLRIDVISNASVKFYVDDVEVAENTTNIPSADDDDFAWAVMLNGTKGTSWRELYVDRTMMAWSEQ